MGWIYLAESEDLALHSVNGLDPLHIVKSIPIVKEFSCQECTINVWFNARSGMTSLVLTDLICTVLSILYTEDFPARISALQDMEKDWRGSEADYFSKSCAWPKKSSPSSFSLKMSQQSPAEGDFESLEKLPRWGMIVAGVLYPLHPLERYIKEIDGSYLPTPDASMRGARKNQNGHQVTLQDVIGSGKLNPQWVAWLMGYPIDWTDLELWAMQWFLSKRKKRSKS